MKTRKMRSLLAVAILSCAILAMAVPTAVLGQSRLVHARCGIELVQTDGSGNEHVAAYNYDIYGSGSNVGELFLGDDMEIATGDTIIPGKRRSGPRS